MKSEFYINSTVVITEIDVNIVSSDSPNKWLD